MIHKVDDGYVISLNEQWLPGLYDSEKAAESAIDLPCDQLAELMGMANERAGGSGGLITSEDIAKMKKPQ